MRLVNLDDPLPNFDGPREPQSSYHLRPISFRQSLHLRKPIANNDVGVLVFQEPVALDAGYCQLIFPGKSYDSKPIDIKQVVDVVALLSIRIKELTLSDLAIRRDPEQIPRIEHQHPQKIVTEKSRRLQANAQARNMIPSFLEVTGSKPANTLDPKSLIYIARYSLVRQ